MSGDRATAARDYEKALECLEKEFELCKEVEFVPKMNIRDDLKNRIDERKEGIDSLPSLNIFDEAKRMKAAREMSQKIYGKPEVAAAQLVVLMAEWNAAQRQEAAAEHSNNYDSAVVHVAKMLALHESGYFDHFISREDLEKDRRKYASSHE